MADAEGLDMGGLLALVLRFKVPIVPLWRLAEALKASPRELAAAVREATAAGLLEPARDRDGAAAVCFTPLGAAKLAITLDSGSSRWLRRGEKERPRRSKGMQSRIWCEGDLDGIRQRLDRFPDHRKPDHLLGLSRVWGPRIVHYDPAQGPCHVCGDHPAEGAVCLECHRSREMPHAWPMRERLRIAAPGRRRRKLAGGLSPAPGRAG